jgi:hypothetical protein
MALVAAVALSCATPAFLFPRPSSPVYLGSDPRQFPAALASSSLLVFSATLLLLALATPWNQKPRLWRAPGVLALALACFASLLIAFQDLYSLVDVLRLPLVGAQAEHPFVTYWLYTLSLDLSRTVGLAIAAFWFTLLLARRFRPLPHWLDRLGRVVGILWVLTALAAPFIDLAPGIRFSLIAG